MKATESEWKEIEGEEKKKIENFEGEVIVLIPTPPTSNLYILNILAKISEVIHLIKDNNKYRDESKKIQPKYHFLILIDSMRDVEYTRKPLEEHYGYLIKDVKENIDTLAQIRFHEFQSLVNIFIMSLEGLSDKERREIISNLHYFDIKRYIEDCAVKDKEASAEDIPPTSLEGLRRKMEGTRIDEKEKAAFYTFFTPYEGEDKYRYAMADLLRSLLKLKGKNKIVVVMDTVREIIKRVITENLLMPELLEKAAIVAYPNPVEFFGTESGLRPPSFSNLLSKYLNEVSAFKYGKKKNFYYVLDKMNSRLFPTGGESEETLTEEEIKEIINKGFLTIQINIIQQLSTII